jgi:hypothetical protein
MAEELMRPERLQIMLSPEELKAVDDFRFQTRMPSRAAAVRELLKRGLAGEGFEIAVTGILRGTGTQPEYQSGGSRP